MSISKLFPLIIIFFTAGCFASENTDEACFYSNNKFEFREPKHKTILNAKWQHTKDVETDEYVDRLVISYENGDVLIVEHRYCAIYSFKAVYHSFNLVASLSELRERVAVIQGFNLQNETLTISFTEKLKAISDSSFNNEKNYRLNFDAVDKKGQNGVDYSLSYDPLGSLGLIGSATSLSVDIGAE